MWTKDLGCYVDKRFRMLCGQRSISSSWIILIIQKLSINDTHDKS
jgi:hypothetical protein